jgi:hypothetical protein
MARELSMEELKRLARLGAQARLGQIEEERRSILLAFPGLTPTLARRTPEGAAGGQPEAAGPTRKPGRRRRRKMTAAEKKTVSERMKKFWAARKQGDAQ